MPINYLDYHQHLEEGLKRLVQELPGPMSGFARLHRKSIEDGALRRMVNVMLALAIRIFVGCEGCIAYHVHDAVEDDAGQPELLEAVGVGLLMGGGSDSIYVTHALEAIDQFQTNA